MTLADQNGMTVGIAVDTSGFSSALDDLEKRSTSFGTALGSALQSATVKGRGLESVLRSLALRMSDIALSAGLKPLENLLGNAVGGLTNAFGSALGFAKGGVPGSVTPFADGGVVRRPTFFPTGGELGLMGEAGAEAILPLARGSDGRLGVASAGGERGAAPSIVFNVSTPDASSFRKSEAQVTAMLARAVSRGRRGL